MPDRRLLESVWLRVWDWLQLHHACPCHFGLGRVCDWSERRFMERLGGGPDV